MYSEEVPAIFKFPENLKPLIQGYSNYVLQFIKLIVTEFYFNSIDREIFDKIPCPWSF